MNKNLTEIEITAYTAGIIDGEGCISIDRDRYPNGSYRYRLNVRVTNTNKELIDWLYSRYEGSVYQHTPTGLGHKRAWTWHIVENEAEKFLEKIYRYLLIKLKQAQVGLTYSSCKWQMGRETFYIQMKELNRRGIKPFEVEETP